MIIVAHRGVPSFEPENTIRSFIKAEEFKADMIELDVRLSRDLEMIVIHDWRLKRLFGINEEVKDLTLPELKKISIGAGREIPTLAEVLQKIQTPLNLHIKVGGMEEQLITLLKMFPHKVLISSVFPRILKKIRALDGNIQLGLIIGPPQLPLMFFVNWLVSGLNLHSIHLKNNLVPLASMSHLAHNGRKVIVWNVNSVPDYNQLVKLGVEGIITDYPQLFK